MAVTTPQRLLNIFTARACSSPLEEAALRFERQSGVAVKIGVCSRHCASANAEEASGGAGGDDFLQEIADAGFYDCAIAGAEFLLDDGEVRGIIARGERRSIARRSAALLVPAGNPKAIAGLRDMTRPGLRIAVSVLDCLKGVWEDVAGRTGLLAPVRRNIVFYANGCIAIIEAVAQGKVDAAFGWSAFKHLDPRIDIVPLSAGESLSRGTAIGMLATCKQPALARQFMEYLTTPEAKASYAKFGWET